MSTKSDGHCVWYGVCHHNATVKTKKNNCAYDGPPKALDSSGIERLRQWCPHLVPQNDQDVVTCCDNVQVKYFTLRSLSLNSHLSPFTER